MEYNTIVAAIVNNAQLINQDSGNVEYYTPSWIIEAARTVMDSIDLDPASSDKANEVVKAKTFFSEDGLQKDWRGNIWLNHPFNRSENTNWIFKLVHSYDITFVKQACCITYASTSEKWFQPLTDFPQCYFYKRVNYIDGLTMQPKKGVTKGSVVTYLGPNVQRFYTVFKDYGKVMIPYGYRVI